MANLALDRTLTKAGIGLAKVAVGDRYVLEEMLRIGANLGGEQSGHLLFLDHATTGDGIVSALQLIGVMRERGASLGELAQCCEVPPGARQRAGEEQAGGRLDSRSRGARPGPRGAR